MTLEAINSNVEEAMVKLLKSLSDAIIITPDMMEVVSIISFTRKINLSSLRLTLEVKVSRLSNFILKYILILNFDSKRKSPVEYQSKTFARH